MTTMEIEPIGYLRSCFGSKFAVPRQPGLCPSAWGVLEFCEKFRSAEAVRGLDGFSHVWLIFGFHETADAGWHPTVRPPRLGGNERVGVFASRSTYRPNGLGLSLVKLDYIVREKADGLEPPVLHVSGVDLVDGTPVFDVKPYLPYAEANASAASGYATEEIPQVDVQVDEKVRKDFEQLDERSRQVILEVLALDPRPAASENALEKQYGALLCGRNIRFRFEGATCWISTIERP